MIEDDDDDDVEEVTMADPTLISVMQTRRSSPPVLKEQQQKNIERLMEKIERQRQRQAAQHRWTEQPSLTPSNPTSQRLVVSPAYRGSVSSSGDERSVVQEQSASSLSSSSSTVEFVFSED